jgi:hypothetical protein
MRLRVRSGEFAETTAAGALNPKGKVCQPDGKKTAFEAIDGGRKH